MKAEVLRKSILQMAIQGKLVPQNSSDEPASVLLQKIRTEKEKLIKEGKIKKDKTDSVIYKGEDGKFYEKIGKEVKDITDQLPFEIPDSWAWVYLKDFVLMSFSGKSPKYSKTPTPHKVVGQQANQWGGLDLRFVKFATEEFIVDMPSYYYLQDGDVLLNTLGNGTLGRSSYYQKNNIEETLLTDGHLFVFRTSDKILSRYLSNYFVNKYDEIVKSANGSTNQTFLSLGKTMKWLVPVPPFAEQVRIVSAIEKFEPLLNEYDKLEQQAEKLDGEIFDKLKKSILQYAIQGKLVPQDSSDEPASVLLSKIKAEKEKLIKEGKIKKEKPLPPIADSEKPFDIPDSWQWVRWGELSESIQYGFNAPAKDSGRIKMVRISDINENDVNWDTVPYCDIPEKEIQNYLLMENDILFARTGGTVGKSYLVKKVAKEAIYAGYLIRTRYSDLLCPEYLKYFMDSGLYWSQLKEGTIATAQPNCNGKTLSKMILPLPPLNEQKRIVARIEQLFAEIDKIKAKTY